jgi:FAD/FMN-containing dehydrogenase
VVTSLTFRTVPAPAATGFRLLFDPAAAADVIDAWQRWSPDAPRELAASLLVTASPLEVCVAGSMVGDEGSALAELARLGIEPVSSAHAAGSHREAKRFLVGADDSADGMFASRNEFFREPIPRDVIEALVAGLVSEPAAGQARELDFSPWGGAYTAVAPDATAFPHRDARFLLKQTATVAPGERPGPWLDESFALTHPHGTGAYPNFPEPDLPDEAYYLANTDRLHRIRAAHDPDGVFTRRA